MKTKKFIKEVEELGFRFLQCTKDIEIYYENYQVAYIFWHWRFYVGTTCWFRDHLPKELQEKLYDLIDEYARTPIEDREEQQKFYLKFITESNNSRHYLNYRESFNSIELNNKTDLDGYKTQFTQKEIDELKKKLGVTFSDFEQIPIEEVKDED